MELLSASSVKFNKYAGLQTFADASALFLNVDTDAYANVFDLVDNEVRVTWHASPKTNLESDAIKKLVKKRRSVYVFARRVGEPYVCCGLFSVVEQRVRMFVLQSQSSDKLMRPKSQFVKLIS